MREDLRTVAPVSRAGLEPNGGDQEPLSGRAVAHIACWYGNARSGRVAHADYWTLFSSARNWSAPRKPVTRGSWRISPRDETNATVGKACTPKRWYSDSTESTSLVPSTLMLTNLPFASETTREST